MADILGTSRRNNARDGLSGLLAIGQDRFVQVLEGPGPMLDRLLDRLAHDRRHEAIEILDRAPIDSRLFGDWSMAGVRFTPDFADQLRPLLGDHVNPEKAVATMVAIANDPLFMHL